MLRVGAAYLAVAWLLIQVAQTVFPAFGLGATLGRWNEAIDLANKAIARDPLRPTSHSNLGLALLAVKRDTEAEAALQEMQQETDEALRLSGLPLAFHAVGRRSESAAELAAMKGKYAGDSAYQIAEVHAFRGEVDLAFEWLDLAYNQRDGGVTEIKSDRLMRGFVEDPRHKAFLRKLKLPE